MFGTNNYMPYLNNTFMHPGMMRGGMYSSPMMRGIGGLGRSIGGNSLFGGGRGIGGSVLGAGRGIGSNALGGASRMGLFGRLRGMNWSNIMTNTGKTLDVINRGIPIVKQTGPMFNNMKTMFRLASAFKDESDTSNNKANVEPVKEEHKENKKEQKEEISPVNISSNATPSFFV